MENNLGLLAVTAIEDKLQENVPEVVEVFKQIGIKIWVLTGDKVETAITVAKNCNLLNQSSIVNQIVNVESV